MGFRQDVDNGQSLRGWNRHSIVLNTTRRMKRIGLCIALVAAAASGYGLSEWLHPRPRQVTASGPDTAARSTSTSPSDSKPASPAVTARPASSSTEKPKQRQKSTSSVTAGEIRNLFANLPQMETGDYSGLAELAELNERLQTMDVYALTQEVLQLGNFPGRSRSLSFLMSALAGRDPAAAWALAQDVRASFDRRIACSAVIARMARSDLQGAISMIDDLTNPELRRSLRNSAITAAAQVDPRAAVDLLRKMDLAQNDQWLYHSVFAAWASNDVESAKMAAAQLPGKGPEWAASTIAWTLASSDPQAAWNYAMTIRNGDQIVRAPLQQVATVWAQTDPQEAIRSAMTLTDEATRNTIISTIAQNWAQNDFDGALKFAVSVSDPTQRADILAQFAQTSTDRRQEVFTALLDYMPPGDNFGRAVRNLVEQWAQSNPIEASIAIKQLPPGKALTEAVRQVAWGWKNRGGDPQEMLAWAKELPVGEARNTGIRQVFDNWGTQDPKQAFAAISKLPVESQSAAQQAVAEAWARKSPEDVLQWSSSMTDPNMRANVVDSALRNWASVSPTAAARYLQTLPQEYRDRAMNSVVQSWSSKDVNGAAVWLRSQPQTPGKDRSIETLSTRMASEDPSKALEWAATVSDKTRRTRLTEQLARSWLRQEPAAAKAWVAQSGLSEEERTRILR